MSRHSRLDGLRRGQEVEVEVEKVVYRGLGLARHQGQVVFVPRALPGERLRVRIESESRGYVRASLLARLGIDPRRREAPCPHAARCGGCTYQDVEPAEQLRLKEAVLLESLGRAGIDWTRPIPLRPSPERGWRARAVFHVGKEAGQLLLGLHEEGSHRVVGLTCCQQVSDELNAAAAGTLAWLQGEPALAGRVQEVAFSESYDRRELAVTLHGRLTVGDLPSLARGPGKVPSATGYGVSIGDRYHTLQGSPFVHSEVRGRRLRAHCSSFFQGNRFLTEDLVREVVERVPGGRVLDLYAGVGLFAGAVAPGVEEVVAVEGSSTAADDAANNTEDLRNVRHHRGDVLQVLAGLPGEPAETVIVDPPRTGLGPGVVEALGERAPERVIYVSCDPPTLARDLRAFAGFGYALDGVSAFDLFPDTFHLESVAVLQRA